MNPIQQSKCRAILKHFGGKAQNIKTVEELAELIVAISKDNRVNIVEEIADVYIMLQQMKYRYAIKFNELDDAIDFKLDRTVNRCGIGENSVI